MNILLQSLHSYAFQGTAPVFASAVIAGLWQGILLALMCGVVLRLNPRTTATARFIIWTIVFAASAVMPLLHLAASRPVIDLTHPGVLLSPRWSYLLAGIWIATAAFRLVMLVGEVISLRHLWRSASPIAEEKLRKAGLLAAVSERGVEVCTTPEVDRPSVIGFFAPKILVPDWLFAQLSEVELQHVVLHEMEHLRRHDDWLNLFQKLGLVVFPLNPAMFWIDRRLSTEREIACDDGVLARTGTPRAYASSLTAIAERRINLRVSRRMVALALGAFGPGRLVPRGSEFGRRIESILGQRPSGRPALAALLVLSVLGYAAAMSHAPEFVSFGTAPGLNAVASAISVDIPSTPIHVAAPPMQAPHLIAARFNLPTKSQRGRNSPARLSATLTGSRRRESGKVSSLSTRAMFDPSAQSLKRSRTPQPFWLTHTSWKQSTADTAPQSEHEEDFSGQDIVVPVSRVVVRTPDGRFFVAPYAAVPIQAGWLIVQL